MGSGVNVAAVTGFAAGYFFLRSIFVFRFGFGMLNRASRVFPKLKVLTSVPLNPRERPFFGWMSYFPVFVSRFPLRFAIANTFGWQRRSLAK